MGTVTNSLIQNNGNSNQQPDPKNGNNNQQPRLLVTVHIILDLVVGYCSKNIGPGCWLLFPLHWIRLLVTVPIILD
jgi:hypothetical protein